jgi:CRISPR type III-B/RAMP module RAMP protein Cmr6
MPRPFPDPLKGLVGGATSLSLRFDRGYDGYDGPNWRHRIANPKEEITEGKRSFLTAFTSAFNKGESRAEYEAFLKRRTAALQPLEPIPLSSTAAIIVGIGRWNPVEVGFTLDRLTGSPFLPGSSVKGLLVAAAKLVAEGDLEGDEAFWNEHRKRIFGEQETASTFDFYDAYPSNWPTLEVDVMTPHHGKYYGNPSEVPADWDDPVPVSFLRLAAKTPFLFWCGPRQGKTALPGDIEALKALLITALDWLGIGAKTTSGYGWFDEHEPAIPSPAPKASKGLARARYAR